MNRTNRYVSDEEKCLGNAAGAKLFLGISPKGKRVVATTAHNSSNYVIQFEDGGEIPPELQGEFTSIVFAQTAVQNFIAKKVAQEDIKANKKVATKDSKSSMTSNGTN